MVKEKYKISKKELNLSVTCGEINSVIRKDITKSACRVYENGYLGIAGTMGEMDDALMEQAAANLELEIAYPGPAKSCVRADHNETGSFSVKDSAAFLKEMEELLALLGAEFPEVIFSNKIRMVEVDEELSNDAGTDMKYSDRYVAIVVLLKHVKSISVFDDALVHVTREFQREEFLAVAREHLTAFLTPMELPESFQKGTSVKVIAGMEEVGGFLFQNLDAQSFGRQTSFFNGKLGEKLFADHFTLRVDRSRDQFGTSFFDMEGNVLEDDRCDLIRDGVLVRPFADSTMAQEFGFENTATGAGEYDSVPENGDICFTCKPTAKTLRELVGDDDAIYISMMSGGDTTSEGRFASPVQTAFLYRDGKLVGRLPEFGLAGGIYEMFGKDYVGCTEERCYEGSRKMVVRMTLE